MIQMERLKVVVFTVKDRQFAIASRNIKEIVDSLNGVKPLFYGGKALRGLMHFGGDLISVLDTAVLLGLTEEGEYRDILVCRIKGMDESVGITATEIKGMENIILSNIRNAAEDDPAFVSGYIETGEDGVKSTAVTLLDLGMLLNFAEKTIAKL